METLEISMWGPQGDISLVFDSATLLVQTVQYTNASPLAVAVLIYVNGTLARDGLSPANATRVISAGAQSTIIDVSGFKFKLVQSGQVVSLPQGVSVGVRIPA